MRVDGEHQDTTFPFIPYLVLNCWILSNIVKHSYASRFAARLDFTKIQSVNPFKEDIIISLNADEFETFEATKPSLFDVSLNSNLSVYSTNGGLPRVAVNVNITIRKRDVPLIICSYVAYFEMQYKHVEFKISSVNLYKREKCYRNMVLTYLILLRSYFKILLFHRNL